MPGQHALLSPSAAHRWLHCTAAPRLEAGIEDRGSTFAEEGTLAHAFCARKLKTYLSISTEGEDAEIEELRGRYYCGEMEEYTDLYRDIVLEKYHAARARTRDARLLVETKLDFGKWIPGGFGTADAIIIADGEMEVIDFKYGKGVRVEAQENPQMKIYALGAYDLFSFEYNIRTVRMTIIQPRIDNVSDFSLDTAGLLQWAGSVLKPKADEAYRGGKEPEAGEWCKFCKVRSVCKALAEKSTAAFHKHPEPRLLTPEEMARDVLPLLPVIKAWVSDAEEYCLQQALSGTAYDGYKIVEGRSVRKIADPEKVVEILATEGIGEEQYLKPAELRSITDLERLVGKKKFSELCAGCIIKPQGKPALVPESDKRPAMNSAAEDFRNIFDNFN